jgi:hypothetical protein
MILWSVCTRINVTLRTQDDATLQGHPEDDAGWKATAQTSSFEWLQKEEMCLKVLTWDEEMKSMTLQSEYDAGGRGVLIKSEENRSGLCYAISPSQLTTWHAIGSPKMTTRTSLMTLRPNKNAPERTPLPSIKIRIYRGEGTKATEP